MGSSTQHAMGGSSRHTHTHILHTTHTRHEHVLVPAFAIYAPEQVPYAIERYSKEVKVRQALRM